ncbi:hypothetical protein [Microbacterium sp. LWS13-1.2]|uniref:Uncharacterized protein n=1 Tax=Microbacterium sp. LWS13-1.2 TaxID=3135264 RepID=A0AAU6SF40_9MICO
MAMGVAVGVSGAGVSDPLEGVDSIKVLGGERVRGDTRAPILRDPVATRPGRMSAIATKME